MQLKFLEEKIKFLIKSFTNFFFSVKNKKFLIIGSLKILTK
jgi:hypothetical protein